MVSDTRKSLIVAWKSQGISYCLESDNPVSERKRYSFLFLKLSSVLGLNDEYSSCIQNVALKQ